jgi:hypothetical protein
MCVLPASGATRARSGTPPGEARAGSAAHSHTNNSKRENSLDDLSLDDLNAGDTVGHLLLRGRVRAREFGP